jgi:hypothetical protein
MVPHRSALRVQVSVLEGMKEDIISKLTDRKNTLSLPNSLTGEDKTDWEEGVDKGFIVAMEEVLEMINLKLIDLEEKCYPDYYADVKLI